MDRYQPNGTALTPHERELLTILMEECAEVTVAASKVIRFGRENRPPDRVTPNTEILSLEIGDAIAVIALIADLKLIDWGQVAIGINRKAERLGYFLQTPTERQLERTARFDVVEGIRNRRPFGEETWRRLFDCLFGSAR